MAILFITHDLGVIAEIADEVAVMYRGEWLNSGRLKTFSNRPSTPTQKACSNCRPRLETTAKKLPTVSDYVESTLNDDGNIHPMTEKQIDETSLSAG